MIIKNKKNGTNVLAFKDGVSNVRVVIKAGETINVPHLKEFNQIINKSDFKSSRGWFEIVSQTEIKNSIYVEATTDNLEETELQRAEKEVNEYSKNEQTINKK